MQPQQQRQQQQQHQQQQQQQAAADAYKIPPNPVHVFVSRLPAAACSMQALLKPFGSFGEIVNITVVAEKKQAVLEFKEHEHAKAARLASPNLLFSDASPSVTIGWAKWNPRLRPRLFASGPPHVDELDASSAAGSAAAAERKGPSSKMLARAQSRMAESAQKKVQASLEMQTVQRVLIQRQLERQKQLINLLSSVKDPAEKLALKTQLKLLANNLQKSLSESKQMAEAAEKQALNVVAAKESAAAATIAADVEHKQAVADAQAKLVAERAKLAEQNTIPAELLGNDGTTADDENATTTATTTTSTTATTTTRAPATTLELDAELEDYEDVVEEEAAAAAAATTAATTT
jgi:hypothetical protein